VFPAEKSKDFTDMMGLLFGEYYFGIDFSIRLYKESTHEGAALKRINDFINESLILHIFAQKLCNRKRKATDDAGKSCLLIMETIASKGGHT